MTQVRADANDDVAGEARGLLIVVCRRAALIGVLVGTPIGAAVGSYAAQRGYVPDTFDCVVRCAGRHAIAHDNVCYCAAVAGEADADEEEEGD